MTWNRTSPIHHGLTVALTLPFHRRCRSLVVPAVFMTLIGLAQAEVIYKVPKDFGWRKSIPLHLIQEDAVVADLGLSAGAVQKLRELNERIDREVKGQLSENTDRDPQEALYSARKGHTAELNELLSPEMQTRLHQIHLRKQRRPTDCLSDAAVAKELGLSDEQRSQIASIHKVAQRAEMDEIKGRQVRPSSSELQSRAPADIMGVLRDEQRAALETLMGPPLNPAPK